MNTTQLSSRPESPGSMLRRTLRRLSDPSDTAAAVLAALAVLTAEAVLCPLIVWAVAYTEIDWQAYMEQTATFLQGERDYQNIRGGTGPLVYPAGFLYLFSGLRAASGGGDIAAAQALFAAMYLATQAAVLALYVRSKVVPPWAFVLLAGSKRLHSIYLLRLFNDGAAMCIAYMALAVLAIGRRPAVAVALFSAAVSLKMNVLLMAPPVLVVLLRTATPAQLAAGVVAGAALQGALAAPFLAAAPVSYASKAFELSRVFLHRWTVNLKFLPEHIFQSPGLAAGLLAAHLLLLAAFAQQRWTGGQGLAGVLRSFWTRRHLEEQQRPGVMLHGAAGIGGNGSCPMSAHVEGNNSSQQQAGRGLAAGGSGGGGTSMTGAAADKTAYQSQSQEAAGSSMTAAEAVWIVWTGNFIGIVCARTLHYQFYSWYCHSLPFLLWSTSLRTWQRLAIWLAIEVVWNVYPPTAASSLLLLTCHCVLLSALWRRSTHL